MDDINLFSVITVLSFLLSCPLMLFAEGVKFTPGYLQGTVSVLKIQTKDS
jgi:solute carrier family 35 protein E1